MRLRQRRCAVALDGTPNATPGPSSRREAILPSVVQHRSRCRCSARPATEISHGRMASPRSRRRYRSGARRVRLVLRPESGEKLRERRSGAALVRSVQNCRRTNLVGVRIPAVDLIVLATRFGPGRKIDADRSACRRERSRQVEIERPLLEAKRSCLDRQRLDAPREAFTLLSPRTQRISPVDAPRSQFQSASYLHPERAGRVDDLAADQRQESVG